MSAIGQGGVSILESITHSVSVPVTIPAFGGSCVLTHNVGRKAFQVLVTGADPGFPGGVYNPSIGIIVTQTDNVLTVANFFFADLAVYIAPRWEENTVELNLISAGDPSIVINEGR